MPIIVDVYDKTENIISDVCSVQIFRYEFEKENLQFPYEIRFLNM